MKLLSNLTYILIGCIILSCNVVIPSQAITTVNVDAQNQVKIEEFLRAYTDFETASNGLTALSKGNVSKEDADSIKYPTIDVMLTNSLDRMNKLSQTIKLNKGMQVDSEKKIEKVQQTLAIMSGTFLNPNKISAICNILKPICNRVQDNKNIEYASKIVILDNYTIETKKDLKQEEVKLHLDKLSTLSNNITQGITLLKEKTAEQNTGVLCSLILENKNKIKGIVVDTSPHSTDRLDALNKFEFKNSTDLLDVLDSFLTTINTVVSLTQQSLNGYLQDFMQNAHGDAELQTSTFFVRTTHPLWSQDTADRIKFINTLAVDNAIKTYLFQLMWWSMVYQTQGSSKMITAEKLPEDQQLICKTLHQADFTVVHSNNSRKLLLPCDNKQEEMVATLTEYVNQHYSAFNTEQAQRFLDTLTSWKTIGNTPIYSEKQYEQIKISLISQEERFYALHHKRDYLMELCGYALENDYQQRIKDTDNILELKPIKGKNLELVSLYNKVLTEEKIQDLTKYKDARKKELETKIGQIAHQISTYPCDYDKARYCCYLSTKKQLLEEQYRTYCAQKLIKSIHNNELQKEIVYIDKKIAQLKIEILEKVIRQAQEKCTQTQTDLAECTTSEQSLLKEFQALQANEIKARQKIDQTKENEKALQEKANKLGDTETNAQLETNGIKAKEEQIQETIKSLDQKIENLQKKAEEEIKIEELRNAVLQANKKYTQAEAFLKECKSSEKLLLDELNTLRINEEKTQKTIDQKKENEIRVQQKRDVARQTQEKAVLNKNRLVKREEDIEKNRDSLVQKEKKAQQGITEFENKKSQTRAIDILSRATEITVINSARTTQHDPSKHPTSQSYIDSVCIVAKLLKNNQTDTSEEINKALNRPEHSQLITKVESQNIKPEQNDRFQKARNILANKGYKEFTLLSAEIKTQRAKINNKFDGWIDPKNSILEEIESAYPRPVGDKTEKEKAINEYYAVLKTRTNILKNANKNGAIPGDQAVVNRTNMLEQYSLHSNAYVASFEDKIAKLERAQGIWDRVWNYFTYKKIMNQHAEAVAHKLVRNDIGFPALETIHKFKSKGWITLIGETFSYLMHLLHLW